MVTHLTSRSLDPRAGRLVNSRIVPQRLRYGRLRKAKFLGDIFLRNHKLRRDSNISAYLPLYAVSKQSQRFAAGRLEYVFVILRFRADLASPTVWTEQMSQPGPHFADPESIPEPIVNYASGLELHILWQQVTVLAF